MDSYDYDIIIVGSGLYGAVTSMASQRERSEMSGTRTPQ